MSEIDLIPDDYRTNLERYHWLKVYAIILAVIVAINGGLYTFYFVKNSAVSSDIDQLVKKKDINNQQATLLSDFQSQRVALEQEWELLNGLRGGAGIEDMLVMIDRSLKDGEVWFVDWEFIRAGVLVEQEDTTVNTGYFIVVPKGKAKTGESRQVQTHMSIRGEAKDHAALSRFVNRLFEQVEVYDVRILNTSLKKYLNINVVEFNLKVVVNSAIEIG
ncbi:MAG: hypothetical protein OEZ38_06830 [Gammaproteobacteria bacterium]|nr:hypothetical protein [Gammaproteobacteria bacterium]